MSTFRFCFHCSLRNVATGGLFPLFENVSALFDRTAFATRGTVDFLQYVAPDGSNVTKQVDENFGRVQRSAGRDSRVAGRARAVSIIVDAVKTAG